ncbi:MAG: Xaa-Pro aminopeptidase [Gammaproteobacteria bacterium RIFCSPHIGHO2_12_FULL_43_28]|nr:MAG: Xaa-Pro aminopeptidase [Gammaproteobacteria bacterium RIFCSPHIGHO2_12_FULL_43_28]
MIKMTEYEKRRKDLMNAIGANSIVILPAATEKMRNGDAHYAYRQHSDFYYLTGFAEPEAFMVLLPKRKEGEYLLFNRVHDRDREIWDGPRAGQEGAIKDYLADQAFPVSEFELALPELIVGRERIHYPMGYSAALDTSLTNAINKLRGKIRSGAQPPVALVDVASTLHEMRLFKSHTEIAAMQKAIDISQLSHMAAMQVCKPGMYEYQLEAELTYQFQKNGARFPAYNPIVGAGKNACVLHYVDNNCKIEDDSLVLIDAGAEYQYYAADITRTFPANGKFTAEQKAVYNVVLDSQKAAIKAAKPGAAWTVMQEAIVDVITEGLHELGILKGSLKELVATQAYFPFYMHRSGHWLGLDVHDVGSYQINNQWRKLEPGMVLTVEPGIYISSNIPGVPKRWHNIGVRIEDNILITENGCDVLSKDIPKEVADIEALMKHS